MDSDSEQIKDVFAHFGLAIFQAQALERQLAITLATKYGPGPTRISREEFDSILEGLFSRTLGRLVNEMRKLANLSDDEVDQLQEALKKRNWLAHSYFWERAVDFLSESGRNVMIGELQEAACSFETLDELFKTRTLEWGESVGLTQQDLGREMERLLRGHENS